MAELVLGVIGVIGPVYKFTVGAIHFIIDIKDVPKNQEYLLLSLRLEEKRFYSWGEHVGLIVDDPDSISSEAKAAALKLFGEGQRGFVFDVLAQIQVLFEDFYKTQQRHNRLKDAGGAAEEMPTEVLDSQGEVTSPQRSKFLKKAWKTVATKSTGGWNRLRWTNFDGPGLQELIERFTAFNDRVTALLDSKLQREIANTTQETYRHVLQMATEIEQFRRIVEATQWRVAGPQDKEMKTFGRLAEFKMFHVSLERDDEKTLAIEHVPSGANRDTPKHMKIDAEDIQITETKSSRSKGKYGKDHQDVWIEWKKYHEDGPSVPAAAPPEAVSRANKLCRLLKQKGKPNEFRVPHCLGFFDNQEYRAAHPGEVGNGVGMIGFVFEQPANSDSKKLPTTLRELLDGPKPSTGERVALAQALANSVLFLHTVDWLHKGLRSDNVVFFVKQGESAIDYSNPILSGFADYARPAKKGEHTEAPDRNIDARIYRHPLSLVDDNKRTQYRKTFDIYSLGLIFLELAYWLPIDEVLEKFDEVAWVASGRDLKDAKRGEKGGDIFSKVWATSRAPQQKGIRTKLLDGGAVGYVAGEMGKAYQQVVRCCLEGGPLLNLRANDPDENRRSARPRVKEGNEDVESAPEVGARLGEAYFKNVVRKLDDIRI